MFTLGQADEASRAAAQQFVEELADLVEDRPSAALRREIDTNPARGEKLDFERRGCKVVLSFREDFLAEVEGLRRRMPSLTRNRYRLLPMNVSQARAVIASGGSLVDGEVAERIVGLAWRNCADAPAPEEADSVEVDPALLSVICSELNLRRRATGAATIEPALLAGAEREILADFYERSLSGSDAGVRQFVEDELITAAGYRDSFAFDDALARPGVTREALQRLVTGRLLRVDERFGVRRLELTHDVLTRVVKESRDTRRAREAEALALAREREAALRQQRAQRRERAVWAGAVAAAALLVAAFMAGKWAIERDQAATEMEAKAATEKEAAEKAIARLGEESKAALERADMQAAAAAAATARAGESLELAAKASRAAEEQTRRANQTERDALATDLIVAARTAPAEQLPLRLLLGAEAVRRYPERLDAQVEQLARLVAAHRVLRVVEFDAPIRGSAASGDGSVVLVGTAHGDLALIDARSGGVVGRWKLDVREVGVQSLRIRMSADARVALIDLNHTPHLLRLVSGQPLRAQPIGRYGRADDLVLSSDGQLLARVDLATPAVEIHSLRDGAADTAPIRVALPRPTELRCMSLDALPGGVLLGTRTETWSIDPLHGRIDRKALPGPTLAHTPDCTKALVRDTADDGGQRYRAIDVRTGADVRVLKEVLATQPRKLLNDPSFVAGGAYVAANFADAFELWPLAGGTSQGWPLGRSPRRVAASTDGRWLALVQPAGRVELQRRAEPQFTTHFALPEALPTLHFGGEGNSLVAVGDYQLQVIRLEDNRVLKREQRPSHVGEIEFSADGTHLGAAPRRGAAGLALWDARSGQPIALDARFTTIEFSPNGTLMAAYAAGEARIRVFDLAAGLRPKAEIDLPGEKHVGTFAFDGSGQRLAIAVQGAVVIRDLRDASLRVRIPLGESPVRKLSFHPREPVIAAVLGNGGVRAFGLPDGRERWRIEPEKGASPQDAVSVAYSPGGEWMVVGRRNGVVALHDPRNGALRLPLVPPHATAEPATNLVFIEGTTILSAGGLDGPKDFWDIAARRWLGVVGVNPALHPGEGTDLEAVAISPRGRRLALKHADDTVSLHGWDPATLVRDACAIAGRNLTCNEWRRFMRDLDYRKTCEALPAPEPACTRTSR